MEILTATFYIFVAIGVWSQLEKYENVGLKQKIICAATWPFAIGMLIVKLQTNSKEV